MELSLVTHVPSWPIGCARAGHFAWQKWGGDFKQREKFFAPRGIPLHTGSILVENFYTTEIGFNWRSRFCLLLNKGTPYQRPGMEMGCEIRLFDISIKLWPGWHLTASASEIKGTGLSPSIVWEIQRDWFFSHRGLWHQRQWGLSLAYMSIVVHKNGLTGQSPGRNLAHII